MPKVRVCVDLSEDTYEAYVEEAHRKRVKVETVISKAVNRLLRELDRDADKGPDFIIPS